MASNVDSSKRSTSNTRKKRKGVGIFTAITFQKKVYLPFKSVGKNIKDTLLYSIKSNIEGKCIEHGFIRENSCRVITYSAGQLIKDKVCYEVMVECEVCNPVEDMIINKCLVKNVTKAGIRAEMKTKYKTPFVIFISRDHQFESEYFSSVKENDLVKVKVIGSRFELNDPYISIIAELVE